MSRPVREVLVCCLLVALGVLGRWAQPAWNFTPLVALTAVGGFYFRSPWQAALVPAAMLAASDLWLLPHDNGWVQLCVYAMTLLPLALGRLARRSEGVTRAVAWGACGFAPATAFFLVTNFAVWATKSLYAPTLAGLGECYAKAIPFYGPMLAGDVFYVTLAAGCLLAARAWDAPARSEAVAA